MSAKKYTIEDIGCYANGLLFGHMHLRHILFTLVKKAAKVATGKDRRKYLQHLASCLLKDTSAALSDETSALNVINVELCNEDVVFEIEEDELWLMGNK